MPNYALPRHVYVFPETTFGEPPADWDASGLELFVIEPDVSGIEQQLLDSENIRPRQTFSHDKIYGLKSGSTVGLGMYMTAAGVNAAEAAQAVATPQTTIMKAALAGRKLGFGIGFSGGTAAAPEIDADPGGGYVAGDWIFAYDTSAARGEFYQIESIAAFVLTLDRDLFFVPDPGGADVAHACITIYIDEQGLADHDDANYDTLSWLVQGEHTDDVYGISGCKPAMSFESITAGEPTKLTFENQVTKWAYTSTAAVFAGPSSGIAPNVAGTGCDTIFRLADTATPLTAAADVHARGSIEPNLAIGFDATEGPNGCEGVHGYVGNGFGEGGPTVMVEYDVAYRTQFEAATKMHALLQVGTSNTASWAIHWPQLEYSAAPSRADEGGLTTHALAFRAQENPASVVGLTGDDIAQRRAPFTIVIVA